MPYDRTLYPDDWGRLSEAVRFVRAAGRCEAADAEQGGRCQARHGLPHPVTGSRVVLTTAHLNHRPSDCRLGNLRAMCQRCHIRYDAPRKAAERRYGKQYSGPQQARLF